jgi:hypothetical protein
MSSVTFSTTVGGDGSTVTDDDDATTGLRNGGWRTRFVPALTQEVAVAGNAVASATAALSSKNAAAASASTATTQASNASTSATNAANSATAAAASYDSFDDRYLGAKSSDPTLDNDGNALLTGAIYWNTASSVMKVWSGSAWVAYNPAISYLPLAGGTMTGAITFASGQTVDGTNKIGYLNIPLSGIRTASYTLVASDVGKFIELGTSGSVVVPASVFAAGDAISIFNNTSASISCTCSAVTTVYKGGTDADIASFSVTTRGVATILFITATVAVVTGNLA